MSDWSVHSPIEYLVMFFYSDYSLFRLFLYSDYSWNTGIIGILIIAALRHLIECHVWLILPLNNWIFTQSSATPITPGFQYLVACQADLYTQPLNFQSSFSYSNYSCMSVLDCMSGWSVHSAIEYSVNLRFFRLSMHSSIELHIRLICKLSHWVFSQPSAIPIIPAFRYWIAYQADPCTQQLNIHLILGYSDHSCIPVLDCMSGWSFHSTIEYSLNPRLIRSLLDSSIGLHVRLICKLSHWVFSQPSAIPIIPAFQYWIACQADL